MKVKSIVRNLLLAGMVSSIACTAAFADQNANKITETSVTTISENGTTIKTVEETGDIINLEISDAGNGEYSVKASYENGQPTQLNFDNFKKVKFLKENGKIFYEGKEGKQIFQQQDFDAATAKISDDGTLYYTVSDGVKMKLEMYEGTDSNGQEVSFCMSVAEE